MKQHPIPQNILDIEFKLFSKFTVREFVYIASGIGIGAIFLFALAGGDLPPAVAIPLFIIFSGTGLFLGMATINDQKAEVYLKNFFLSINTPTLRVWRSRFYKEKDSALLANEKIIQKLNKQDKIIGSSSTTLPSISDFSSDKIDNDELSRLSEIDNLIKTSSPAQVIPAQVTPNTSNNSNVQPPLNNIQSTQPLNTTVPAQNINDTRTPLVNTDNSIVEVSETNIESLEIDNSVPININNSISLKLIDQNNNPIPNALAIIKDSKNNIIQAKVSDNLGLLLTNKEYSAGKYNVYIQSKEHKFPLLVFNIANKIYPIIIIKEI